MPGRTKRATSLGMKKSILSLVPVSGLLAACVTASDPDAAERSVIDGHDFAEARCADCHAIGPGMLSPNPSAPEFARIANSPGLTRETLGRWLNNSHDFPREMYFAVPEEKIDDLVAYMMTMQSEDYRPMVK